MRKWRRIQFFAPTLLTLPLLPLLLFSFGVASATNWLSENITALKTLTAPHRFEWVQTWFGRSQRKAFSEGWVKKIKTLGKWVRDRVLTPHAHRRTFSLSSSSIRKLSEPSPPPFILFYSKTIFFIHVWLPRRRIKTR